MKNRGVAGNEWSSLVRGHATYVKEYICGQSHFAVLTKKIKKGEEKRNGSINYRKVIFQCSSVPVSYSPSGEIYLLLT